MLEWNSKASSMLLLAVLVAGCGDAKSGVAEEEDAGTSSETSTSSSESSTDSLGETTAADSSSTGDDEACADFEGVLTPAEASQTPHHETANFLEWVALLLTDDPVVSVDLYARVQADYTLIDGQFGFACPELAFSPRYLLIHPDDDTRAEIEAGTYNEWDCVNELYAAEFRDYFGPSMAVQLSFLGNFDVPKIAVDYESLPGIDSVEFLPFECGGEGFLEKNYTLEACAEGDIFHYRRAEVVAKVDGTHLRSQPGSEPEVVCSWSEGEDPCPPLPCSD